MASRKQIRLDEIRGYVEHRGLGEIGAKHFDELQARLAPISRVTLQRLLKESRLPLSPELEGVRQENLDELERTLVRLADEYRACSGDHDRSRQLRRIVILSKDHARFAARRASDEERRRIKEEMAAWLLIWLENPPLFPQWVKLRRSSTISSARSTPP